MTDPTPPDEKLVCLLCGHEAAGAALGALCPQDGRALVTQAVAADHARLPDPLLGRVLAGRFPLLSRIGEGGFGAVYQALQFPVGREVAVKVMSQEHAANEGLRARFFREAKVVGRLTHRATVTLYDYGEGDDGLLFMALELIRGRSVRQALLDEGAIEPARAVHLAIEVLGALSEAHGLGLIHRDLKPANLMLARDPEGVEHAKVLDFGMAKVLQGDVLDEDATRSGVVLGTPKYLSPEQARGRDVGPSSDVYGLGVTLWEMLAGRPPYAAPSTFELLMLHAQADIPPLPAEREVPRELETIVRRAMAKAVEDRYPDAGSLLADLRVWSGQEVSVELSRPPSAAPSTASFDDTVTMGTDQLPTVPPAAPTTQSEPSETSASQSAIAGETLAAPAPRAARPTPWAALGAGAVALAAVVWLLVPGEPEPPTARSKTPRPRAKTAAAGSVADTGVADAASVAAKTLDAAEAGPDRSEMFLEMAELAKGKPEEGEFLRRTQEETTRVLGATSDEPKRADLLARRALVARRLAGNADGPAARSHLLAALTDLSTAMHHGGSKESFRRYRDGTQVAEALHGEHSDGALDYACADAQVGEFKHRRNHCAMLLLRAGEAVETSDAKRAAALTCRGADSFLVDFPGQSASLARKRKEQKGHYDALCRKLRRQLGDAGE